VNNEDLEARQTSARDAPCRLSATRRCKKGSAESCVPLPDSSDMLVPRPTSVSTFSSRPVCRDQPWRTSSGSGSEKTARHYWQ